METPKTALAWLHKQSPPPWTNTKLRVVNPRSRSIPQGKVKSHVDEPAIYDENVLNI